MSFKIILDIDECSLKLESTLCDKECVNTEGSYYCRCPPSFALASDGKTCIECGINTIAVNVPIQEMFTEGSLAGMHNCV